MKTTSFPFYREGRIALSPWTRAALDASELAALNERCDELDVIVSTVKRSDGGWMVRVSKDQDTTSLVGHGPALAVIAGALSDWEEAYG